MIITLCIGSLYIHPVVLWDIVSLVKKEWQSFFSFKKGNIGHLLVTTGFISCKLFVT